MSVFDLLKKQGAAVEKIPVKLIHPNPFQPRKSFSEEEQRRLEQSIAENGLIQPVSLRKKGEEYEIIAGERRLRACAAIGMEKIPAVVHELSDRDAAVWALVENLQRSDLGVFEEAEGIEKLISGWDVSREEAARRLGIAPSTLSNKLRLLKLSPRARKIVEENNLTERHARELLRLHLPQEQEKAAEHIAARGLSVWETERYITSLCAEKKKKQKPLYIVKDVRLFINTFEHAVGVMKNSGIGAVSTVTESEENIIYTVSIPKSSAFQKRGQKSHRTAPAYSACTPSVI